MSLLSEKFEAAVKGIQSLPKDGPQMPSRELKLKIYSLYKQATEGSCHTPRPTKFFDFIGSKKWEAWNQLGDISKEEAMTKYVDEVKNMVSKMAENNVNSDEYLADTEGPFYKFIKLHGEEMGSLIANVN